jgi:hypothetical protein
MSEFDPDAEDAGPVEVPASALPAEVLRAVLEEYVTREGTDYGDVAFDLEAKVGHVRAQLKRGEARIMWDPATESVTLVPGRR